MRATITLWILLAALSQTSPSNGGQQQEPTQEKHDVGGATLSSSATAVVNNDNTPPKQEDDSKSETAQTKEKSPWGDVPTWLLVIVGGIAAWIGLRTLNDIKKQTKNTEIAAKAAQTSAQAVINAERAWIMVNFEWIPTFRGIHQNATRIGRDEEILSISAPIRFKYTNEGKSIAWVDEQLACLEILRVLPERPCLDMLEKISDEPDWIGAGDGKSLDYTVTANSSDQAEEDHLIVWGVVRYRDAFGEHETTFGFNILPDMRFERLSGYPAYNQNT